MSPWLIFIVIPFFLFISYVIHRLPRFYLLLVPDSSPSLPSEDSRKTPSSSFPPTPWRAPATPLPLPPPTMGPLPRHRIPIWDLQDSIDAFCASCQVLRLAIYPGWTRPRLPALHLSSRFVFSAFLFLSVLFPLRLFVSHLISSRLSSSPHFFFLSVLFLLVSYSLISFRFLSSFSDSLFYVSSFVSSPLFPSPLLSSPVLPFLLISSPPSYPLSLSYSYFTSTDPFSYFPSLLPYIYIFLCVFSY